MTDRELFSKGFWEAFQGQAVNLRFEGLRPYRDGRLQGACSRGFGHTTDEAARVEVHAGRRWR